MQRQVYLIQKPQSAKSHPHHYLTCRTQHLNNLLDKLTWNDLTQIDMSNILTADIEKGLKTAIEFLNQAVPKCYSHMPTIKRLPAYVFKHINQLDQRLSKKQLERHIGGAALNTLQSNGLMLLQTTMSNDLFKQPYRLSQDEFYKLSLLYVCFLLELRRQNIFHQYLDRHLFDCRQDPGNPLILDQFSEIIHHSNDDFGFWLIDLFDFTNSLAMAYDEHFIENVVANELSKLDEDVFKTKITYANFYTYVESKLFDDDYQKKLQQHNQACYQQVMLTQGD